MDYTRPCRKCGALFDAFNHDAMYGDYECDEEDLYIICEDCNDEFWDKWNQLPKVKKVNGSFQRIEAHDALIKEYHKEDYFGMNK